VHWSRTGIRERGGSRTGPVPDRSWEIGTVWPCQKARLCPLNFRARADRAIMHDRAASIWAKKKEKYCSNSVHRSDRSYPGPDRRPNSAKAWIRDRTEEGRSGSSRSSVRSSFGPKTTHPYLFEWLASSSVFYWSHNVCFNKSGR